MIQVLNFQHHETLSAKQVSPQRRLPGSTISKNHGLNLYPGVHFRAIDVACDTAFPETDEYTNP